MRNNGRSVVHTDLDDTETTLTAAVGPIRLDDVEDSRGRTDRYARYVIFYVSDLAHAPNGSKFTIDSEDWTVRDTEYESETAIRVTVIQSIVARRALAGRTREHL